MFLKKHNVSMLLVVCYLCGLYVSEISATYCSLDRMKMFAMDACEHLGVRERRSIGFGSMNSHTPKYWVNISRGNYPFGGYLKVGQEHYNRLSLLDVSPRYKAKKFNHIMHEKKMRSKREDNNSHYFSDNITYCCYHKCDEDFFCN